MKILDSEESVGTAKSIEMKNKDAFLTFKYDLILWLSCTNIIWDILQNYIHTNMVKTNFVRSVLNKYVCCDALIFVLFNATNIQMH